MVEPRTRSVVIKIAITLLLAVVLWMPRGLMLDQFVAVDERSWLTRSGNFYLALSQGDFADTFQRYHPGVTTMWLGTLGFFTEYPGYASDAVDQIADMSEGVEGFLRQQGYEPIDVMASGRRYVVAATVIALLISFWIAVDLFGLFTASTGFLLIAFEPFLLGLSRMLHVDGLSSVFMFLALLAYLRYIAGSPHDRPHYAGHKQDLVIAGVAAGLAWLSKSPALFLIPFMALITLYALWQRWRMTGECEWRTILRPVVDAAIWLGIACAVFMLFWPAMWVHPVASLQALFSAAGDSAASGHSKALFYNGKVYAGDPGLWFYPHTFLWRISPVTLIGLVLGIAALALKQPPLDIAVRRRTTVWLLLFALLFTFFMTLGAKKFPRYLLPAYMPLLLVGGAGWAWTALWAARLVKRRWVAPAVVSVSLIAQAFIASTVFPYYFTYYSPLMGGAKRAPQVMMIGLGEGLDQAARYLRELPGAEENTVASWYRGGSFNYFYPYESVDIEDFFRSDYAVIYAHQWQREVPDLRTLDYFASLTPEHTFTLNDIEYVRIYNLQDAPPPDFFVDWSSENAQTSDDAGVIRMVRNELSAETLAPGDTLVLRTYYMSLSPMAENLSALVRLIDEDGNEVARSEGWPYGSPTSTWTPGEVYVDGHELTIPADQKPGYLRSDVTFYNPDTQETLTPARVSDGEPLPQSIPVGYVQVEPVQSNLHPFERPYALGEQFALNGAELDGQPVHKDGTSFFDTNVGDSLLLDLYWHMNQYTPVDYTVMLQLIDPDGEIAAQWDGQPVNGLLPTSLWRSDDVLRDEYVLSLPQDLAPGEYRLLAGLYDLESLERLPVSWEGMQIGDTIPLATIVIR